MQHWSIAIQTQPARPSTLCRMATPVAAQKQSLLLSAKLRKVLQPPVSMPSCQVSLPLSAFPSPSFSSPLPIVVYADLVYCHIMQALQATPTTPIKTMFPVLKTFRTWVEPPTHAKPGAAARPSATTTPVVGRLCSVASPGARIVAG